MNYIEEFDKVKTKVLKYVLYKKRTEKEVRQKFIDCPEDLLNEVIEYLKIENYINDENYVNKSINEFKILNNMSIKEVKYKLISKGINSSLIDEYIYNNKEEMLNYEIDSAKKILTKKENVMEKQDIINYLIKKGYIKETIKIALDN